MGELPSEQRKSDEKDPLRSIRRPHVLGLAFLPLAGCVGDGENDMLDHRGDIDILVDGESIDLDADPCQAEHADDYALAFHLHEDSDQWYNESENPVTIAEALTYLPEFSFDQVDGGYVLVIDDATFDTRLEGVSISAFVNDEPVSNWRMETRSGSRSRRIR